MAVVLDFNLVCKHFIDLDCLLQSIIEHKSNISIDKISCIDNWLWENQQNVKDISSIQKRLVEEKIIVINLKTCIMKNAGIYVEKIESNYLYNLWINTEGFPELDTDNINSNNKRYFQYFYEKFGNILKAQIMGIGIETVFQYKENIFDTIKESKNIIAWVVNEDLGEGMILDKYIKREVKDMDFVVFEKI